MKKNQHPVRGEKEPKVSPINKKKAKDTIDELRTLIERLESAVNKIPPGIPIVIPEKTMEVYRTFESMVKALPEKVENASVKGIKEGTDNVMREDRKYAIYSYAALFFGALSFGLALCLTFMK